MEPHLTATECHLPHGTPQCYPPPESSEHTPPNPSQTGWYSIYIRFTDPGRVKGRVGIGDLFCWNCSGSSPL